MDCTKCGDLSPVSNLAFGTEMRRPGEPWAYTAHGDEWSLCQPCCDGVITLLTAGTSLSPARPPGFPARAVPRNVLPGVECEMCLAKLGKRSFSLALVPIGRNYRRHGLFKHAGTILSVRLCSLCFVWVRSALGEAGGLEDGAWRQEDWLPQPAGVPRVATFGLLPPDERMLAATMAAIGAHHAAKRPAELAAALESGGVAMVAADRRAGASRVVARLPQALRRRCLVVARSDTSEDLAEALRLGAGDFMTSPLSPEQITGSLERASRPAAAAAHDRSTGLPVLRQEAAAAGTAGILRFHQARDCDLTELTLVVRRVLRGYDRVGVDASGRIAALLRGSAEELRSAAARLEPLLSGFATIETVERAASAAAA